MSVPTPRELVAAKIRYQDACRRSNLTLGRAGEVADLVEVRDRAHQLVALLSAAVDHYRGTQVVVTGEQPDLVTVAEMAAALHVSRMTVYRWAEEHPDDVVRFRGNLRIKGSAFRRAVNEGE